MTVEPEEYQRIIERARQAKATAEAAQARGEKATPPPVETSPPTAVPGGTTVTTGTKEVPPSKIMRPSPSDVPSPSEPVLFGTGNAPGMVQAGTPTPGMGETAADALRVASGSVGGNILRGGIRAAEQGDLSQIGTEIQKSYQGELEAKERLGPTGAKLAEAGGTMVGAMGLPASMYSMPFRAAMTSAGINLGDTVVGRLEEGKPVFSNPQEYFANTTIGAGLGLFGYHLGKFMGYSLLKLAQMGQQTVRGATFGKIYPKTPVTDPDILKIARKNIDFTSRIYDSAHNQMVNSGVQVKNSALAKLLNNTEKLLDKSATKNAIEFSPQVTPRAWEAFNTFRHRVAAGTDVDLASLFQLRKKIYDGIRDDFGVLKPGVSQRDVDATNLIDKEINNFVQNLYIAGIRGASVSSLRMGQSGWRMMDKDFTRMKRTEELGTLVIDAARNAKAANLTVDEALQKNFAALLARENVKRTEAAYTKPQLDAIEAMVKGSVGQRNMARLDRWVGGPGFVGQIYRALFRSPYSTMFGAEVGRQRARNVMSAVSETPVITTPGVKLGAAAGATAGTTEEGQGAPAEGLQGLIRVWNKATYAK